MLGVDHGWATARDLTGLTEFFPQVWSLGLKAESLGLGQNVGFKDVGFKFKGKFGVQGVGCRPRVYVVCRFLFGEVALFGVQGVL